MIVVKQHDLQDCGVCSLASIIRFYDGFIPIERLRLDTHTTKDGATAYNLLNATQKYGFETKGVKIDSLEDSHIILPAIAHLKFKNGLNHFVVIYEITKTKVIIMDPAQGKVVMKKDKFYEVFSHVLLMFYPKEKITYLEPGKSIWQIFGELILKNKKIFGEIVFISIMLTVTTIASSYYFKVGIEAVTNNTYLAYIKLIFLVFLIVTLFKCTFTYLRGYLENHLNKNIDVLLQSDFLNHLFRLPSATLSSRSSAEIISRVGELNNIKSLYTEIFVNFLLDFILMFSSIPILIMINSNLFFILFFVVIIYFIIGIITTKPIYQKAYRNISCEEDFNNELLESVTTFQTIKNLNITPYILKNIEEKLSIFLYDSFKLNDYLNKEENLKNSINELGFYVINTVGIYLIMKNKLTIANLITFNSLMSFFLNPIKNLIDAIPRFNFFKATFAKINDFINIPTEKLGKRNAFKNHNIEVKKLNFSYNDYHLTLKDVEFSIAEGAKVMFKGKSGCGKSTMCKILNKEFTKYAGAIFIGNKNLKDYSLKTIRENILYVSQNENLFTDTIYNNLVLGRNVTEEKITKIVKVCLLEEVIDKKPFRYETIINNFNNSISGGEKQRLILARSLLKDAKILILDESLSEVDYEIERQIIQNIKTYFKDKTLIYITHKNQDDLFDQVINFQEAI